MSDIFFDTLYSVLFGFSPLKFSDVRQLREKKAHPAMQDGPFRFENL